MNAFSINSLLSSFEASEFEFNVVKWTLNLLPIVSGSAGLLLLSLMTIEFSLEVSNRCRIKLPKQFRTFKIFLIL